jgi:two-component system, response regulator
MNNKQIEILLIEDDADDAELTIHALSKHHLATPVFHIDDGEKALEYLFGEHPNPSLILLDLKMPRVDGIQILGRLKADPEKCRIPVVALISSREGRNYLESFDLKADGYIIKPVDFKQFVNVVENIGISSLIFSASPEKPSK